MAGLPSIHVTKISCASLEEPPDEWVEASGRGLGAHMGVRALHREKFSIKNAGLVCFVIAKNYTSGRKPGPGGSLIDPGVLKV